MQYLCLLENIGHLNPLGDIFWIISDSNTIVHPNSHKLIVLLIKMIYQRLYPGLWVNNDWI